MEYDILFDYRVLGLEDAPATVVLLEPDQPSAPLQLPGSILVAPNQTVTLPAGLYELRASRTIRFRVTGHNQLSQIALLDPLNPDEPVQVNLANLRQLTHIDTDLDTIDTRLTAIETGETILPPDILSLPAQVTAIEARLDTAETDLVSLGTVANSLGQGLADLGQDLVDLDGRVTDLENAPPPSSGLYRGTTAPNPPIDIWVEIDSQGREIETWYRISGQWRSRLYRDRSYARINSFTSVRVPFNIPSTAGSITVNRSRMGANTAGTTAGRTANCSYDVHVLFSPAFGFTEQDSVLVFTYPETSPATIKQANFSLTYSLDTFMGISVNFGTSNSQAWVLWYELQYFYTRQ